MPLDLYVDSLFASPWAMTVFVALTEKGLPFSVHTVDLDAGDNRLPAYRDLSLTTRVPALAHDGFVLTESTAICEYLDDTFIDSPSTLPRDRLQRARARQLQAWLRSDLAPLRAERSTDTVFFQPVDTPLSADAQAAAAKLIHAAGKLVDGANLFGAWSAADTDLAIMLQRLIVNGDPVPQRLEDYAAGQWARPSVQQWLAQHQPG